MSHAFHACLEAEMDRDGRETESRFAYSEGDELGYFDAEGNRITKEQFMESVRARSLDLAQRTDTKPQG